MPVWLLGSTHRHRSMLTLCTPAAAVQFDCKEANWQQQCAGYPNLCSYPAAVLGPNEQLATGPCVFSRHALRCAALHGCAARYHSPMFYAPAPGRSAPLLSDDPCLTAMVQRHVSRMLDMAQRCRCVSAGQRGCPVRSWRPSSPRGPGSHTLRLQACMSHR